MSLVREGSEVCACAIVLAEYYSGIERGMAPSWDQFIDLLPYCDISRGASEQAGSWRREFARRGKALTVADTLIAALALELDAVLLTENLKDFPMDGVRVMSVTGA